MFDGGVLAPPDQPAPKLEPAGLDGDFACTDRTSRRVANGLDGPITESRRLAPLQEAIIVDGLHPPRRNYDFAIRKSQDAPCRTPEYDAKDEQRCRRAPDMPVGTRLRIQHLN